MESRAPPPSAEEETVKEVLSETPTPKPPLPFNPVQHIPIVKPENQDYEDDDEKRSRRKPVFRRISEEDQETEKTVAVSSAIEETSEISEICSLSESVSTTTVTRDDDEDVRQRQRVSNRSPMKLPRNRSFSGDLGARRDRAIGKSPTRRSDQSPGRRTGRPVQSREPVRPVARRALRTEPYNRREPGESSGRRSRSPAMTRTDGGSNRSAAVGRSPSGRKSGRSPGRAAATATPVESSSRRATEEEARVEGKWAPPTSSESLENPLVSLECFIFL